ncbi:MAG TPA: lipid A export permease/ATP-binding protein MsbA, partial [Pseudomonadales bacterium]|nr:lipid A export permease/ATP-binding protein MsbA [Pseudomonadales bacterium]
YMKDLVLLFIVSIVGFGIYAASNPMLAKLNGLVIQAIEQKNSGARWELPLMAIGIFVLRGVGSFLGTYYNAYVSARMINNIRTVVFEHITRLPVSYFHQHSEGTILQRVTGSINLMTQALTDSVKTMIREGLTVIALLGYVFYLNWQLSLVFLAVAPLMGLVVNYTSRRFRAITRKNEGRNASLLQITREMISGHEVMRIFNGQSYENARHKAMLDKNFKDIMKVRKIASLSTPVMQLLVAAALAGMIFLLLMPEILSAHSTADLVGYLTAVALVPKSMKQLSGLGVALQRGIVGAQLIFELLDSATETDAGKIDVEHPAGAISARHVKFRYRDDQPYVLDDISFDILPGEMVALVGKSGGGKSTLATLLQRFYDVNDGSITIDGVDIRDYKLENLRKHISLVSQNLVLFNDTIRNNIAYGAMNGCSDADIMEAARKAHALEFIEQQANGLDTVIGDNGLQLSGGQRQRIAIARAFLKNAPILILDEATSALDNESEQIIQQALNEVMQGRTTIVIAHRLSTIERANKILVVSKGHIVEQGSHTELLQHDGVYKMLYTAKDF